MPDEQVQPQVIIISGPNGAGKSTAAPQLLEGALAVSEFVNADVIARGLSAFEPERVAMAAGRIMLHRLDELAEQRASFAFETTLASRSFAPWISNLKSKGYVFHLICLWLPSPEMAIARVKARVLRHGHNVPDDVVQRRYARGLQNFFNLYKPLATTWNVYYSGDASGPVLVAEGREGLNDRLALPAVWSQITNEENHA